MKGLMPVASPHPRPTPCRSFRGRPPCRIPHARGSWRAPQVESQRRSALAFEEAEVHAFAEVRGPQPECCFVLVAAQEQFLGHLQENRGCVATRVGKHFVHRFGAHCGGGREQAQLDRPVRRRDASAGRGWANQAEVFDAHPHVARRVGAERRTAGGVRLPQRRDGVVHDLLEIRLHDRIGVRGGLAGGDPILERGFPGLISARQLRLGRRRLFLAGTHDFLVGRGLRPESRIHELIGAGHAEQHRQYRRQGRQAHRRTHQVSVGFGRHPSPCRAGRPVRRSGQSKPDQRGVMDRLCGAARRLDRVLRIPAVRADRIEPRPLPAQSGPSVSGRGRLHAAAPVQGC